MTSNAALPTTIELLDAFSVGAIGKHEYADAHCFANYDALAGMGALMWARVAVRDREVFRAIYLDGCQGTALDYRIAALGGPARIRQSKGVGTVTLAWDNSGGTSPGVFLKGTRIAAIAGTNVRYYRIAEDVVVDEKVFANPSGQSSYLTIGIEAETEGDSVAVDSSKTAVSLKWEDVPYDSRWQVLDIKCVNGAAGEKDSEYLVRYREWKRLRKPGYVANISRAMLNCGAGKVAIFESDFIDGEDYGINRVFVGGSLSQATLDACRLALDSCVPFGCTTTLGTMTLAPLSFDLTLKMSMSASKFNPGSVQSSAKQAIQRALRGTQAAYVFRLDALRAELSRTFQHLQATEFGVTTPSDTDVAQIVSSGLDGNLTIYDSSNVEVRTTLEGA